LTETLQVDGPTFKIERILKGEQRTDRFDVDAKLVADEDEPAQIKRHPSAVGCYWCVAGPAISRFAKLSAAEPRHFGQSGDVLNARGIRAARRWQVARYVCQHEQGDAYVEAVGQNHCAASSGNRSSHQAKRRVVD
jgi:hypothetical protein